MLFLNTCYAKSSRMTIHEEPKGGAVKKNPRSTVLSSIARGAVFSSMETKTPTVKNSEFQAENANPLGKNVAKLLRNPLLDQLPANAGDKKPTPAYVKTENKSRRIWLRSKL